MKLIKLFSMLVLAELFLYLLGAFVGASFDISTWDPGSRAFVAWLGLMCAVPFAILTMSELNNV